MQSHSALSVIKCASRAPRISECSSHKDFLWETAEKKSQTLAPINTWKTRKIAQNPHQVWTYSVFLKYVFLSQLDNYRDMWRDDFCCHIMTLFHVHWLGEFPAEVAGMCRNKFQRNPATQTKESLLLQSKLGQTALVLLLKNWLTLGTAEVQRLCRHLAIVPWLGAAFLPFKVSYKLQFQI